MEYELLFFTSATSEDKIPGIKKELEEILTSLGGKLSGDWNDIGKRKFAHPIKRETHGFYSFVHFKLEENDKLPEIGKRISLNDKIMRHIIVRIDEIKKITPKKKKPEKEIVAEEIPAAPAPEEKKVEDKPKANLDELDEKLNELLEENPAQ